MYKYRRLAMYTACLVISVLSAQGVGRRVQTTQATQSPQQYPLQVVGRTLPDHKFYDLLFRRIVSIKERGNLSGFKASSALSDQQIQALDNISSTCLQKIQQQDAKAQVIINSFRARYPGGVVPQGQKLPPPPPELKMMQQQRDAIVLEGREQLRQVFGDSSFARFDALMKKRFGVK